MKKIFLIILILILLVFILYILNKNKKDSIDYNSIELIEKIKNNVKYIKIYDSINNVDIIISDKEEVAEYINLMSFGEVVGSKPVTTEDTSLYMILLDGNQNELLSLKIWGNGFIGRNKKEYILPLDKIKKLNENVQKFY